MNETISTSMTPVFKFIIAPVALAMGSAFFFVGVLLLLNFITISKESLFVVVYLFVFSISGLSIVFYSYKYSLNIKTVSIDEKYFYISNYFSNIKVEFTNIVDVKGTIFIKGHPVELIFSDKTEFGKSIVFIPKTEFFLFLGPHPIVEELKKKCNIK